MNLFKESLFPFIRTEHLKLYESLSNIKSIFKENNIDFSTEVWANKECTNAVPWTIISIKDTISLFFAKDKLFKIVIFNKYMGALTNGIRTGMSIDNAMTLDDSLYYDEWNEDYETNEYWLEDDENNLISSISIFIPEVSNDEIFDKYEWCETDL